jgi:16S rRNA (cytosine967-C5)-methyltransferase
LASGLLAAAAVLVKPSGFVVYSTCTVSRRENADAVQEFLTSEAGEAFSVEPLTDIVPDEWKRFVGPEGYFQSLPERGSFDGHFVGLLKRGA